MSFPRNVYNSKDITVNHISGITYSGIQIDNSEQYLLGVSNVVGISTYNISSSISLIQNNIIQLSTLDQQHHQN